MFIWKMAKITYMLGLWWLEEYGWGDGRQPVQWLSWNSKSLIRTEDDISHENVVTIRQNTLKEMSTVVTLKQKHFGKIIEYAKVTKSNQEHITKSTVCRRTDYWVLFNKSINSETCMFGLNNKYGTWSSSRDLQMYRVKENIKEGKINNDHASVAQSSWSAVPWV